MKHANTWREVGTEAKLLLIGIPVFIWTMLPIYHLFLFAISPKDEAFSGKLWPDASDAAQLRDRVPRSSTTTSTISGCRLWNSLFIAVAAGRCSRCSSRPARRSRSAGSRCAAAAR